MAIALSATIHPSRMLAVMLVLMVVVANGSIAYLILSFERDLIEVISLTAVFGLASLFVMLRFFRMRQSVQLDISDSGNIILRVLTSDVPGMDSVNVVMIDKSVLWSALLLLHLRSDDGRVRVFVVMRDCLDADSFRRLSVAVRWIAMHTSIKAVSSMDVASGNF